MVLSLALIPDEHDQSTGSNGKPDLHATADKPSSSIAFNLSDAGRVTFSRHVAPIVFRHCAGCHRPDGSAPFSLLTYRDVKKRGRQIAEVTQTRLMPPWLPESSDVALMGDPSLTEQQIATIHQWVEQGRDRGRPD